MHIVPWETCVNAPITLTFREDVLGRMNSNEINLLNKVEAMVLERQRPKGIWFTGDSLAAAILIEPTLVTLSENYHCTVEVSGKYARGMMVVDRAFIEDKPSNCTIVEGVDLPLYERLIWAAGGPYYKDQDILSL
ncbi:unnamed protein product [Allacma fusca]|uniref:Inosine/uridine-preferring nucleoside hydrolase domain-containing protein n=1 Tax=Allacma fusca TaxID=39272 RepID=A0A8J2LKY4_9HEXA|nr:unnamed protein product [Allacma fusca]